jgi:hypothetical protein
VNAPAGFAIEADDPTLTLVVARRSGVHVVGGHVNVADDARDALRHNADRAIEDLETKDVRQYDPDAQLEEGEYFLLDRATVEDSMGILAFLDAGPEANLLRPDDVAERPQLFYATLIGRDSSRRLAFIAKSNPAKVVRQGIFLTPKRDVLTRIEDDVFLFEDRTDMIVSRDQMVVFNQLAFEQWFRDTPVLQERVKDWIGGITEHLPLDGDGADRLAERCRTNSRLRRVLFSIQARGHLKDVSITRIRQHARNQGLDSSELVKNGKLVFDDADPTTLLKLLNEDLFKGGLTDEPFVVDRKSRRT